MSSSSDAADKIIDLTKNFVSNMNGFLDIDPDITISVEDEVCYVDIDGEDLSFLIGYRGDSLSGYQQILAMALYKEFGEWKNLLVDINGYRRAKKERLENMAKGFIDRVRFFSKEVNMPPMQPFERKQIHEFVSAYDDVESYSVGEGFGRHIVLKLRE